MPGQIHREGEKEMNFYKIKAEDLRQYRETEEERAERETNIGISNQWNDEAAGEEYDELNGELLTTIYDSINSSETLNKACKLELIESLIINLLEWKERIIEGKEAEESE